ncbi:MAG: Ribosome recycling factor [uncultured Acidimicrobiales bacterium]|uniref:Ribosome-recycling factor n=1 Tax=uncultured Acidimicrobiales bacterium TaxID=310071 RepID=A0A6J4IGY7_9ACTN|nr:MAG: Ribosome recycling factor [uncultured Acidimicrobiales bacterium]
MIADVLAETAEKMQKAVSHSREDFSTIRTGRASPAFVEKLTVDYYGSEVPLQQIAGFSVPEARTLVIQPYDKSSVGAIEKAIRSSDLGLNPSSDGNVLRLSFPPLTADRRKEYVKMVRAMAEDGRVAIRNLRRAARQQLEALEKDGDMGADELERGVKDLDKLTAAQIADLDVALEHKEQELTEV